MQIGVLDCESTISNKGNPFDQTNKLCAIGIDSNALKIQHGDEPYGEQLKTCQEYLESIGILVLFNGKFDLHWLRRYGILLPPRLRVWDAQLFEHFASNQKWIYPSLEQACARRGLGEKSKDIVTEFWEQGIDTDQIPWEVVAERVISDVELTRKLFDVQYKEFESWSKPRQNLFRLQCEDLLVLEEIEFNGIRFEVEQSFEDGKKVEEEIRNLDDQIKALAGEEKLNLGSSDHKSVLLYGGTLRFKTRTQVGVYKTGEKTGQPRFAVSYEDKTFPRLVNPRKGSETEKSEEGREFFSTDKDILGSLKAKGKGKKLLSLLNLRGDLAHKLSTYLFGIPKIISKMNWPKNMIHGTINQCRVVTGRTSSSKPNLQNMDGSLKYLFTTRYSK